MWKKNGTNGPIGERALTSAWNESRRRAGSTKGNSSLSWGPFPGEDAVQGSRVGACAHGAMDPGIYSLDAGYDLSVVSGKSMKSDPSEPKQSINPRFRFS